MGSFFEELKDSICQFNHFIRSCFFHWGMFHTHAKITTTFHCRMTRPFRYFVFSFSLSLFFRTVANWYRRERHLATDRVTARRNCSLDFVDFQNTKDEGYRMRKYFGTLGQACTRAFLRLS